MTTEDAIKFLEEAARYFSARPTNGEDRAYWSNVYNAENCLEVANLIRELEDARREILSLKDDNKKLKYRLSMMKKIRNEKVFEKLVNAMEKIEGLERNLKTRDEFLVKNDMWMKFVGEL